MSAALTEKPVSPCLLSHREKMRSFDTIWTSHDLWFVQLSCPMVQERPSERASFPKHVFLTQRLLIQTPTVAVSSESAVPKLLV